MMTKPFWNSEKLLSFAALLVSLLTLIVFIYQTNLIRKQQFRSVYPHLTLVNKGTGSLDYQFVLMNQGIGPALLSEIEVKDSSGSEFETLTDYLEENMLETDSIFIYNSDLFPGRLIAPGEEIPLFGLVNNKDLERYNVRNTVEGGLKLRSILNDDSLIINITYESIYEESWTINTKTTAPIKN